MGPEQTSSRESEVPPLENTAFFAIETDDGYVRIEQSLGNQVLYTPSEARDVAASILAAADDAVASDPGIAREYPGSGGDLVPRARERCMSDAHHRAAIAERAARAGGAVARELFRTELSVETKDYKNDLVTEADRDAQQQVLATVREEFPDDDFVCEEESVALRGPEADAGDARLVESIPDAGTCWVVDPIDGTSNFVRRTRTWATSVAAVVDGEAVGSATYLPAMGDLYAAGPESVERDGTEMAVSDREDPETFAASPVGYWPRDQREEFVGLFEAVVERFGDARRVGSFQTTLAYVADGGLDAAICTRDMSPWDTVAGVHMVRQAGGTVTDVHGDPWRHDSRGVVASNGNAHDVALEAAQQAIQD